MIKKTAIVFGATGGIGSTISNTLRSLGYNLGLSSLSVDPIDNDFTLTRKVDVRNPEEVSEFISEILGKFKRIDVVVTAVGAPITMLIQEMEPKDLDNAFSLYVQGLFNIVKAVLPVMISQKSGYIVNIGALRALKSSKQKAAYCSTKAAALMFMNVLRDEVKDFGIKITTINPGFTDTLFHGSNSKRPFLCRSDGLIEKLPITLPSDIAKTVSFLLSLSKGATVEELNVGEAFNFGKQKIIGLL